LFLASLQRWFGIGLAAIAIGALIIVGAQNAPRWLAALANTPAPVLPGAVTDDSGANRIGIVSGHRGNDSGTVCADGLTEAQVNFDHATRVADFLRAEGYTVDILDEFDARLKGYRALALVSIHADSCAYVNDLATGFKVARALQSRVPETEDRLVACMTARYKQATGMRFHANTVTRDMTEYHAFGEIAAETPAAIIETGFMYLDRPVLTRKPEMVAKGITEGVLCFLRAETP
jgi:N-acetylmuramoyl-L-alanine amidase